MMFEKGNVVVYGRFASFLECFLPLIESIVVSKNAIC